MSLLKSHMFDIIAYCIAYCIAYWIAHWWCKNLNNSSIGLVLPSGARFRTVYDKKELTATGKYFYDKSGIPPPGQFDFQQDAVRKGRAQFIKPIDGTQKKISTWDNVK